MPYKRKYRSRPWKKSRRTKYSRRGKKMRFAARVKKVLMKTAETKMYQFADENLQLYHNLGLSANGATTPQQPRSASIFYNIWAAIPKGTNKYQRIGDKISPRGMSLKLWIANKADRPNISYRIMIVRIPKAISGVASTTATVDIFDQTQLGATGNKLLLKVDNDRGFKCLYDRIIQRQTGYNASYTTTLKENSFVKNIWIRNKKARDIVFDSTAAEQIINNPIILMVIPYDAYGTLTTDNIASFGYYGTLYYKDV